MICGWLLSFSLLNVVYSAVEVNKEMKSFYSAIKAGVAYPGQEYTLYETNEGPGVITEQWYAGIGSVNEDTILRYYIDNETEPGIEFNNLFMAHGIGFNLSYENPKLPWITEHIGHTANGGGLFNTYRIPFSKSVKVTAIMADSNPFWYLIRGTILFYFIFILFCFSLFFVLFLGFFLIFVKSCEFSVFFPFVVVFCPLFVNTSKKTHIHTQKHIRNA